MPQVTLLDYTGAGHADPLYAARLLAFTKNTRLNMDPGSFRAFMEYKSAREIKEEIAYMATTIPSSWEFAECKFLISDVSRATAQQITRTRNAAFAMQSQRVTDMSAVTWDKRPESVGFDDGMEHAIFRYEQQVMAGTTLEDARDLLPIGVHCNLVAKYDLRALSELIIKRDSLRVQGPYVEVVSQMKALVLDAWPWAEPFFRPKGEAAAAILREVALELKTLEGTQGALYKGLAGRLAKAEDLIRQS